MISAYAISAQLRCLSTRGPQELFDRCYTYEFNNNIQWLLSNAIFFIFRNRIRNDHLKLKSCLVLSTFAIHRYVAPTKTFFNYV